ncbi:MAG TPA: isoleucine--tRNA ligase [Gemmataceae bacterium]|nr:isoleucine--tRNA ligase [Gemmataceae bacterium]
MPFAKVDNQVNFPALERQILDFWNAGQAFEKLRAKNRGKPKWSFLDGPITANNPMGVHHAWGRTYKDCYQRYFAMTGHELRYQNGFDCQGLWVEVEVEKELDLDSKRDIENLVPGDRFASIDKFVRLCKERVDKFARIQTNQSIRLGMWMNWDVTDADWAKPPGQRKSYFTMSEENNYTIWSFLKKCRQRNWVYRGFDSMPWCARCGVGLSQMEMHEGYRFVAHKSVFSKFPLKDRPGENLLVWTTTPWTLTSNVAAAVNPELIYLKVKYQNEVYYIAKGAFTFKRKEEEFKRKEWLEGVPKLKTIEQLFKEKKGGFEIVGEISGKDMVGWEYEGPFDELPAQQNPGGYPQELATVVLKQKWAPAVAGRDAHCVIAWKDVGETEGTGIVHIAPGCGAEDFELGKEQGIPPIAPLGEDGIFLPGFGDLSGKSALDPKTAEWIFFNLQQKNRLFATEAYPHSYPHCWRCKTELLFRLVDEWYIAMSWRNEIIEVVDQLEFLPESINGKARERDWLNNMGDWMISKKRFWGLALPIWVCEKCDHFDVIGSHEELQKRAVEGWKDFEGHSPHRPWVDKVKIGCPLCKAKMSRVPDVGNPWLDAGIVPYSTMGYNKDRAYWEKWFPADFITESFPGQFRNWFYAILAMSTMMENRPPFKVLLGHGLVLDEKGETMSKSKGNAIAFDEAADKMGADVCRWMYCRSNPAGNINFGFGAADEVRKKFVLKLWNVYAFFCNYARLDGFDPAKPQVAVAERPDIDRWILSDLQLLIQKARESFEQFNVMAFCLEAERFVDDKLSNWYVRRNRRRFWKSEHGPDKDAAYQTLYTVLVTLTKLLAPVVPFLAEAMYQNLLARSASAGSSGDPSLALRANESIHLCDYPEADQSLIDPELSQDMEALLQLVTLGSSARNSVKIKVRQPLAEMKVQPGSEADQQAVARFADQIQDELNIRKVTLHDPNDGPLLRVEIRPNRKTLGQKFGPRINEICTAIEALTEVHLELNCPNGPVTLEPADLIVSFKAVQPGWVGVADGSTQVAIDTRITEELAQAGMAREVVRFVQDLRKQANLEMNDRIMLYLGTDSPKLQQAIAANRDYIGEETLTVQWSEQPLGSEAAKIDVEIDGQPLTIKLRKLDKYL